MKKAEMKRVRKQNLAHALHSPGKPACSIGIWFGKAFWALVGTMEVASQTEQSLRVDELYV